MNISRLEQRRTSPGARGALYVFCTALALTALSLDAHAQNYGRSPAEWPERGTTPLPVMAIGPASVRLSVAQNPKCPPDILTRLARDPADIIRQAVAGNPNCPEAVKAKLAGDSDDIVIETLLRNPGGLSPAILAHLANSRQPKILETIAGNSKSPGPILSKLAHGPIQTEFLLLSLARNPSLPPDEIVRLSKVGDRLVRTFLARQTKLTPAALAVLAQDGDLGVRSFVAQNPHTPADALELLSKDSNEVVREGVAANRSAPFETRKKLAADPSWEVRLELALQILPGKETALLEQLSHDKEAQVRWAVASNSQAAMLLPSLASDPDQRVREAVAKNPGTSADTIAKLNKTYTIAISQIIAARPSLSADMVAQLSDDASPMVRSALAINPALSEAVSYSEAEIVAACRYRIEVR